MKETQSEGRAGCDGRSGAAREREDLKLRYDEAHDYGLCRQRHSTERRPGGSQATHAPRRAAAPVVENGCPEKGDARDWYRLDTLYEARCDIGPVLVGVDVRNGKVFKLVAQEGYAGKLFDTIKVGMNVGEAMSLEQRLFYDDIEEGLYVRGCAGVTLDVPEIDPPPEEVPNYPISAISVYAEEAVAPEGQKGNW